MPHLDHQITCRLNKGSQQKDCGVCSFLSRPPPAPPSPGSEHSMSGLQSITFLQRFNLCNIPACELLRGDCGGLWWRPDGDFSWIKDPCLGLALTSFVVILPPPLPDFAFLGAQVTGEASAGRGLCWDLARAWWSRREGGQHYWRKLGRGPRTLLHERWSLHKSLPKQPGLGGRSLRLFFKT